jgi:hypothetical protein
MPRHQQQQRLAAAALVSGSWATTLRHQQQQRPLLSVRWAPRPRHQLPITGDGNTRQGGKSRGRGKGGGLRARRQPPIVRYVHIKSPHHPTHLTKHTRTSIDVRVAFVRLPGAGGGHTTRGYIWYRGFRMTPRHLRCGVHPYPPRVRCARVRVRCTISRPSVYP